MVKKKEIETLFVSERFPNDAEELVKILVARCKKLNQETDNKDSVKNLEIGTW